MKRNQIFIVILCLLALSGAVFYFSGPSTSEASSDLAMVEMQVSNLTCGSCVETITGALNEISGVKAVDISVTTGVGKVTFNPDQSDAEALVNKVTQAGYPAKLKNLLSRDQYQAFKSEEIKLAAEYVGRIGEQLIPRELFSSQFDQYIKTAGIQNRPEMRSQAMQQAWQQLMQRTLMLQAADANKVLVLDGEVDLRIDSMRSKMPNFSEYVTTRYGTEDNLKKQLKEEMIINRNIDQFVLAGKKDGRQRQQIFSQWFQGLVDSAAIVIYDPELKQAASSGGGCCGSGGSCSG